MIESRFATAADIVEFYGASQQPTMQAMALTLDGKVAAIAGLAVERERYRAFSDFKEELRPHLKSMPVLRFIKRVEHMIRSASLPVVAVCEGDSSLLERLGFVRWPSEPEVFVWPF